MKKIIQFIILVSMFLITSCISIQPQTAQPVSNMRYGVSHYSVNINSVYDLKITVVVIPPLKGVSAGRGMYVVKETSPLVPLQMGN